MKSTLAKLYVHCELILFVTKTIYFGNNFEVLTEMWLLFCTMSIVDQLDLSQKNVLTLKIG